MEIDAATTMAATGQGLLIATKRKHEDEQATGANIRNAPDHYKQSTKRLKISVVTIDRLSSLSDELILRVFSFLPISDLNRCQRLSKKYHNIAADSQLWRTAYYHRFIRTQSPRSSRRRRCVNTPSSSLSSWSRSPTISGSTKHWKSQYKLRHNWSRGQCTKDEIQVEEERPLPPLHIRLHDNIVYTVDQAAGLRAWSIKKDRKLIASSGSSYSNSPTAMAVDKNSSMIGEHHISVAFGDGSFKIYRYLVDCRIFKMSYTHPASHSGIVVAMAYHTPFLVTITAKQILSVYKFEDVDSADCKRPVLVQSLHAQTVWPPFAISLRSPGGICNIGITYITPSLHGWKVGIQEIHINQAGGMQNSRTASAAYPGGSQSGQARFQWPPRTSSTHAMVSTAAANTGLSKPSSISYSHPYLLLSHPDNTLSLYMVTSTTDILEIGQCKRLWGHTSSVSGAQVEGRGKAVSISTLGEEVRLWDLEGMSDHHRRLTDGSVKVRPKLAKTLSPTLCNENVFMRNWVDFDEENVVVLKERTIGRTDLVIYDFT